MKYYLYSICMFFCMISAAGGQQVEEIPFVVSGVVSDGSGAGSIKRFVKYLSNKTDIEFKIYYADNYSRLSSILREKTVSVGWTCGAPYVEDARRDQQQLVSVPLFNNQPLYHSLIITSVKNTEKKLTDFKGKIFAYSDIRSNSGFVAPSVLLKNEGIDIMQYFSLMVNSGNHENSIIAMLNGLADVAAIDEYIWIEYTKKYPETFNVLHEIERTGPFPFTPVVAGKNTPLSTVKKLQEVLVNMSEDPKGKNILSQLGMDGFVNKPASFFEPIEKMMKFINYSKTSNVPR